MLKKFKFIISGLIILIILFSLYLTILFNAPEESDEIRIYNGYNSIFNGYTPKEIASKLAAAAGEGSIILEYTETHHTTTQYRYKTYYNSTIDIFLDEKEFFCLSGAPISLYSRKVPGINISNNPAKGIDIIFGIWDRFLNSLNYQLTEDNYNISINSYTNWSGRVIIRQTCNDNLPLKNTGVVANIIEEDSQINSLRINDWSRVKIERPISISLEDAKKIIYNETQNVFINTPIVDFKDYNYFSETVYYYFNCEIPQNNTTDTFSIMESHSSTTYKNGTTIEHEREQLIGFNFYINVENGKFISSGYGVSKIIKIN